MAHVYAGQPDERQSGDMDHKVSRFRPTYRALSDDEKKLHDEIKQNAVTLEISLEKLKQGRCRALSITALEESIMWGIKELTSNNGGTG